jgi:Ulp1 family protease
MPPKLSYRPSPQVLNCVLDELSEESSLNESPIKHAYKLNLTYSPSNDPLSSITSPKSELSSEVMARRLRDNILQERKDFNYQCDNLKTRIQKLMREV